MKKLFETKPLFQEFFVKHSKDSEKIFYNRKAIFPSKTSVWGKAPHFSFFTLQKGVRNINAYNINSTDKKNINAYNIKSNLSF